MLDKLLGTLLGADEDSRVELVQVAQQDGPPTLEIRLLHDAGDLGWCVHRRIRIAAGQLAELRAALSMMDIDARTATPPRSHLRLVEYDEAL